MRPSFRIRLLILTGVLAACREPATGPVAPRIEAAKAPKVADPTATWSFPLADAGLSIKSDHNATYSSGGNSVYANGACGVSTRIFATTAGSGSGDATLQTTAARGKGCGRTFTLVYPDAVTETLGAFINLAGIESPTSTIPIGATERRHMSFAPGSGRCGTLYFGPGKLGNGVGSDSLWVTRVDASTWHVYSDPTNHLALCGDNGQLYAMTVDFTVASSAPLP